MYVHCRGAVVPAIEEPLSRLIAAPRFPGRCRRRNAGSERLHPGPHPALASSTRNSGHENIPVSSTPLLCVALDTFWYRLLEDKIGGYFTAAIKKQHQKTVTMNISKTNLLWKVSIAKVIADIVLFDGPYLAFFFISTHLMSGSTFKSAIEHMKADILPTFFMDVIVWTPVQLANFRWIPVLYQPVLVNSVNVGWNAYLSYVKHREAPAKATSEK
ncbi:uncharacterized protein BJ171DRAFT_491540 [Polychytrium aggregatum]|uniref:uncharacterized protein n=1 Tax=Polychytrium aggregatum TaxID=110093 RepID=UPI0022FF22FA|nr:uncharacterized protein BJ171DRAFT_491540 [Polychytrium aggregatum]KAI9207810.1 hypothetical protein BJ171DRAFT_491540 [Polychytrium aggregatum]